MSIAWIGLALAAVAQSDRPGQLFERAYFLEQAEGNLAGAVELYERVVEEFPDERGLAARALLRIGLCHERLGYEGAANAYRRLIRNYSDQEEAARIARERLSLLRSRDAGSRVDLPSGATLREVVLADGRNVGDESSSVSPDGKKLAYVDAQLGSLVIYDLTLRKPLRTNRVHLDDGTWVYRWSRDSRFLAFDEVKGDERIVEILDTESGKVTEVFRRAGRPSVAIDWTPDGQRLLIEAGSEGGPRLILADSEGRTHIDVPRMGREHRLSPSGKWIAFVGEEKDRDIYVAPMPGEKGFENAVSVSPHTSADRNPLWSHDGRYLAFLSDRAKSWDLWVVEIEEGRPAGEPFLAHRDIGEPVNLQDWLSDGRLAFTKRAGLGDVWIQPVDLASGEVSGPAYLLPTAVRGHNGQPRFSPDGRRISFRSFREHNSGTLFVADLVEGRESSLELGRGFQNADWYPDGQRLVYAGFVTDGLILQEIELDSGQVSNLGPDVEFDATPAPDVSPDGKKVLFNIDLRDNPTSELFFYDRESHTLERIPGTEGIYRARWSPDGEWIAFPLDRRTLCVTRPDGSGTRCPVVLSEPEFLNAWITWSPDGHWIAFPKGQYSGNSIDWDLWVVSFDGATQHEVGEAAEVNSWWVDWSPDGRNLALASQSGPIGVWVLENFFRPGPPEP